MSLIAFPEGHEVVIHQSSPKRWQVLRRPSGVGPVDAKEITLLCTFDNKNQAMSFAEGYAMASQLDIKVI